jgi:hypothetical protein
VGHPRLDIARRKEEKAFDGENGAALDWFAPFAMTASTAGNDSPHGISHRTQYSTRATLPRRSAGGRQFWDSRKRRPTAPSGQRGLGCIGADSPASNRQFSPPRDPPETGCAARQGARPATPYLFPRRRSADRRRPRNGSRAATEAPEAALGSRVAAPLRRALWPDNCVVDCGR